MFSQALIALVLVTETDFANQTSPFSLNMSTTTTTQTSVSTSFDFANSCGKNNCPSTPLPKSFSKTTNSSFFTLYALVLAVGLCSILITFLFMDNLTEEETAKVDEQKEMKSASLNSRIKQEFSNLIHLYSELEVWLLLPVTLYANYELTFIWFEYNRAFATCLLGVNFIGWTNLFQSVLGAVLCLGMGYVLKYAGVKAGVIFMLTVGLAVSVFILSWTPEPDELSVFLLMAGFSLSQSVSKGQTTALYGIYLKGPAAFSAFSLASPVGMLFGSLVSSYWCVRVKAYIWLAIIFLSIFSFLLLDIRHERRRLAAKKAETFNSRNELKQIKISNI